MSTLEEDFEAQPAFRQLRDDYALGTSRYLVWAGAGLSHNAGLPLWSALRGKLQDEIDRQIKFLPEPAQREKRQRQAAFIKRIPDFWDAFTALKGQLTRAPYEMLVRTLLSTKQVAKVPSLICDIWRLRYVAGVVTLNLDDLLDRGFQEVFKGAEQLGRASSFNLQHASRLAHGYGKILINLHGVLDQPASWVMTSEDRDRLFKDAAYSNFVRTAFTANRCVFVGMQAQDDAIATHFEYFRKHGIDLTDHYWLTSSQSLTDETRNRVGELGILIIEYDGEKSEHGKALSVFWRLLDTHLPVEPDILPINPHMAPPAHAARRSPKEVQALDPEEARLYLSTCATEILSGDSSTEENRETIRENYAKFFEDYHAAIQVAGSYLIAPGRNIFFGYELDKEIGGGAFGRVYKARDPDGLEVAAKITKHEVRDDLSRLTWFRRGVHAMRILSESHATGMVKFVSAFEIPPSVFMEYIEGPNLEEFARTGKLDLVHQGMPILARVAEIIGSAHRLPQAVLHRDIRPSNIMLRQWPQDAVIDINDVVVLDFDLSWYNNAEIDGAISRNMITVLGYLAPEQVHEDRENGITARHAAVDTFGLGMTLLYLSRGHHPEPNERKAASWDDMIAKLAKRLEKRSAWRCFGNRVARLIHRSTVLHQPDRLDFDDFATALRALADWAGEDPLKTDKAKLSTAPTSLILEEIFCRSMDGRHYDYDEKAHKFVANLATGATFTLREISQPDGALKIEFAANKANQGTTKFKEVSSYWQERLGEVTAKMEKAGWQTVTAPHASHAGVRAEFVCDYDAFFDKFANLITLTSQAMEKFIHLET